MWSLLLPTLFFIGLFVFPLLNAYFPQGDIQYLKGPAVLLLLSWLISIVFIGKKSSSIFWNGPLGYVEKKPYDKGTIELAKTIAEHNCFSIIGGGDTLPIIENLNLQNQYSCLSTGGGSLLTYLEGGSLPILNKLNL